MLTICIKFFLIITIKVPRGKDQIYLILLKYFSTLKELTWVNNRNSMTFDDKEYGSMRYRNE